MKENNANVAVITLNYNQSKMTLECIDSILKSNYHNYKLIVVDNGSNDEEFDFLRNNIDSRVTLSRIDKNCGYVGGVNHGLLKGSTYDPNYYLIMNNDTIIDREAIMHLVSVGERYSQNAIVSGKVYHYDKPDVFQYVGGIFKDKRYLKMNNLHVNEKDIGQCDLEKKRDMLDDIFWLLPNKIVKDIGQYSDNFFLYGEQADYALRTVRRGYELVYTPKAKLWHKGSITTGGGDRFSATVNFWRKKSSIIYLYRNTKRRHFIFRSIKLLLKFVRNNILNLIGMRKTVDARSDYAGLIGILYGFKWVINRKPDRGFNPFL